jgi:hypothetical protein
MRTTRSLQPAAQADSTRGHPSGRRCTEDRARAYRTERGDWCWPASRNAQRSRRGMRPAETRGDCGAGCGQAYRRDDGRGRCRRRLQSDAFRQGSRCLSPRSRDVGDEGRIVVVQRGLFAERCVRRGPWHAAPVGRVETGAVHGKPALNAGCLGGMRWAAGLSAGSSSCFFCKSSGSTTSLSCCGTACATAGRRSMSSCAAATS